MGDFFLNLSDLPTYQGKEVFNLKTQKTPSSNKLQDPFENVLSKLIKKIKSRKQFNCFQTKINRDTENIKNSKKVWVRLDETNNFSEVTLLLVFLARNIVTWVRIVDSSLNVVRK